MWVYTSGEVSGRLPFLGWVTILTWQNEPEVARREDAGWRLFGFQNRFSQPKDHLAITSSSAFDAVQLTSVPCLGTARFGPVHDDHRRERHRNEATLVVS